MRRLTVLLTVLLGLAGITQAEHEDENGASVTPYSRRLPLYDGNLLSCYYSTARVRLEDGFVRHWLKLEKSDKIPYYVVVSNLSCNGQPVSGEYRLGPDLITVYVYSDDEQSTADWHIETEAQK